MTAPPKTVRVGPEGQVVIPAEITEALGLEPGDDLVVRLEGRELRLESRRAVLDRLRGKHADPNRSLAQELHEERRAEVEAKGW